MYYKSFNGNNPIYSLQFAFREKYLAVLAPLTLLKTIN